MFIRFVTEYLNESNFPSTGVFQATGFLIRSQKTFDYHKLHLIEVRAWFAENLDAPDKFTTSKSKNAPNTTLSWFKSSAVEHLAKMYELKEILENYDMLVTVIIRDNPGYIVFEDEYQVSALPHRADKNLVK